jgi:hypothetical protein
MRKTVLILFLLLLSPRASSALPHSVFVSNEGKWTEPIAEAVKARLNGTSRYQTVAEMPGAELFLLIHCIGAENLRGAACSFSIFLAPQFSPLLYVPIDPGREISSGDTMKVVEYIFEQFVEMTTEPKIQKAEVGVKASIKQFCSERENAKYCRP